MPCLMSVPFSIVRRLCEWLRRASSRSNQFCVTMSPTPTKKSGRLARSRPDFMMSTQSHPRWQLSLRSRGGFFLRRSRDFLHSRSRSTSSRSGATTAALRSRAAGGGWLAAANRLDLARGRSTGGRARSRSGLGAAGRMMMLMTALRLRSLAALDLRGLAAAVAGFSGTAESGQHGQGCAQRNQLHRTTHDVSLSLHYDGLTSRPDPSR